MAPQQPARELAEEFVRLLHRLTVQDQPVVPIAQAINPTAADILRGSSETNVSLELAVAQMRLAVNQPLSPSDDGSGDDG